MTKARICGILTIMQKVIYELISHKLSDFRKAR